MQFLLDYECNVNENLRLQLPCSYSEYKVYDYDSTRSNTSEFFAFTTETDLENASESRAFRFKGRPNQVTRYNENGSSRIVLADHWLQRTHEHVITWTRPNCTFRRREKEKKKREMNCSGFAPAPRWLQGEDDVQMIFLPSGA